MKKLILSAVIIGAQLASAGVVKIAVKVAAAAPKMTYHAAKKTVKVAVKVLY